MGLVLADDGQFPQEDQSDNQQMEIVPFQTSAQNLNDACFAHLFFDIWIFADVQKDVQGNVEQLILLPDENVEFFQLSLCCDLVLIVVFPPHLNVLAIEQIEPLDLVLEHVDDCLTHLLLGYVFLELTVV